MAVYKDQEKMNEEKIHTSSDEDAFALELTPDKPAEETDSFEELILTPSSSDEQSMSVDLVLKAGDIFKAEKITFEGQEEAERNIAEAMSAYDKAMDQAAGIK